MAKININNIENVEGKYHLMFLEGKSMVENAKNDLRFSIFALLLFAVCIMVFVMVSGFNLFYVAFLGVFLVFFLVMVIYNLRQKSVGKKQCIYAVQHSKTSDIIAQQIDNRRTGKAIVKSMSSTIDKYDANQKFPTLLSKFKRSRKHAHLVGIINDFEKEEKRKK